MVLLSSTTPVEEMLHFDTLWKSETQQIRIKDFKIRSSTGQILKVIHELDFAADMMLGHTLIPVHSSLQVLILVAFCDSIVVSLCIFVPPLSHLR